MTRIPVLGSVAIAALVVLVAVVVFVGQVGTSDDDAPAWQALVLLRLEPGASEPFLSHLVLHRPAKKPVPVTVPGFVTAVAISPDGDRAAVGAFEIAGDDITYWLHLVDLSGGKRETLPLSAPVDDLDWCACGTLAIATVEGLILIRQDETPSSPVVVPLDSANSLRIRGWTPDGTRLAVSSNATVSLVDVTALRVVTSLDAGDPSLVKPVLRFSFQGEELHVLRTDFHGVGDRLVLRASDGSLLRTEEFASPALGDQIQRSFELGGFVALQFALPSGGYGALTLADAKTGAPVSREAATWPPNLDLRLLPVPGAAPLDPIATNRDALRLPAAPSERLRFRGDVWFREP